MRLASYIVFPVVFLAAVVGGVVLWIQHDSSDGRVEVSLPVATPTPFVELKAYISGAVLNPGVYAFNEGDRLGDVMESAGGALVDADLDAINLAARVNDEDHWRIPRVGEELQPSITASNSPSSGASASGKIDINSASASELQTLPGIGPVIADRIIAYRDANGPFATIEDLLDVSGIGPATFEGIRELVEAR